jgi:uncharacterized protein with beta-barrel porin domain
MPSLDLQAGRTLRFASGDVTPFVDLTVMRLRTGGCSETSATTGQPSGLGLTYQAKTTYSAPLSLGVQLDATRQLTPHISLSAWFRGAVRHEFLAKRSVNAAFTAAPGYAFAVQGARPGRDSLEISAGLDLQADRSVSLFLGGRASFTRAKPTVTSYFGIKATW